MENIYLYIFFVVVNSVCKVQKYLVKFLDQLFIYFKKSLLQRIKLLFVFKSINISKEIIIIIINKMKELNRVKQLNLNKLLLKKKALYRLSKRKLCKQ